MEGLFKFFQNASPEPFDVPPEIWLEIFPYLSRTDLQSVSTVSSSFRLMAQPLLFEVLDVSPILLAYTSNKRFCRPRKYLRYTVDRLACYQLPHIAYSVKECWISPYTRSRFPSRSHDYEDDLDPAVVIDLVVNSLSSFPNLSSISFHFIDIREEWWIAFEKLHLDSLWINASTLSLPNPIPLSTITHVYLDHWARKGQPTDQMSIHEGQTSGMDINVIRLIMQPQRIQFISTPRADTARKLLSVLIEQPTTLQTLRLTFAATIDVNFPLALECCPHLDKLVIFPSSEWDIHHSVTRNARFIVPSLTCYEGPSIYCRNVAGQPLKQVTLWGFDERPSFCAPNLIVECLVSLIQSHHACNLEYLKFRATNITQDLISALYPLKNLQTLVIESHDSPIHYRHLSMGTDLRHDAPISNLYTLFQNLQLPPRLQRFNLMTHLPSETPTTETQEQAAAMFTEHFAEKYPYLQLIEIEYGIFWSGIYNIDWVRTRDTENIGPILPKSPSFSTLQTGESEPHQTTESSTGDCFHSTIVSSQIREMKHGRLIFKEQHRRQVVSCH